jgi:O-antigen/teichoic acid export membrane protein
LKKIPVADSMLTRSILRHGKVGVSLFDQGCVSAANFLIIVLLARHFSLADFGVFMIAQLLLTLFITLQNSVIAQPHNILGAQREGIELARLTFVLAVMQISISGWVAFLAAVAGMVLWQLDVMLAAQIAFALALIILPVGLQEFTRRALYTQSAVRSAALNDCITYGLQVLAIVAVTQELGGIGATPVNALLAIGTASCVGAVLGCVQLRGQLSWQQFLELPERRSYRAFKSTCGESWRLGKWLAAQQSVAWLGSSAHGWLLAALLGPAAFGLYRAAYQIVNILNPLRQASSNYLPSRAARVFAQQGAIKLREWQASTAWRLGVPFAISALLIAIAAEPLAKLFYGRELVLSGTQTIVALGALAYTINLFRTPLDYAVLAMGGARPLLIRALWLAAFVLTAGTLLIWRFGITGALLSEIIAALLAWWLTLRVYRATGTQLGRRNDAPSQAPSIALQTESVPSRMLAATSSQP